MRYEATIISSVRTLRAGPSLTWHSLGLRDNERAFPSYRCGIFCVLIQALGARQAFKLGLKFADALEGIFVAILMPSTLRAFERRLQPDLPFMQREGVAPASFHLGVPGIGLGEPVAFVRHRTIDEIQNPANPV